MKITEEWLIEQDTYEEFIDWFRGQGEDDSVKLIRRLSKEWKFGWAWWLWLHT